jgi:frataxin-like iron-binding protein CyaY
MKINELLEQKVDSSWIRDITYTNGNVAMTLNNGQIYQILNMSEENFNRWLSAPSKGNYYNTNVRDSYAVQQAA